MISFMSLRSARLLGLDVGRDPRVAMSSGGVVFVADRPFDERTAREAVALVDMGGDHLFLPPFSPGDPPPKR